MRKITLGSNISAPLLTTIQTNPLQLNNQGPIVSQVCPHDLLRQANLCAGKTPSEKSPEGKDKKVAGCRGNFRTKGLI